MNSNIENYPAKMKYVLALLLLIVIGVAGYKGYNIWKERGSRVTEELPFGKVTAISYTSTKPSAIVDVQIVHEGDILHGVKVIKIHKDKVEFEINGQKWAQQVKDTPNPYWAAKTK